MTLNLVRCALCLISCAAAVQAVQPSTSVTAVLIPDGQYSPVAFRGMSRETDHILKNSGISMHWHVGEPVESVNGLLVVVKLHGQCDMDGPPVVLKTGALGWSYEVNGAILPFSDLDCDKIRGSVESTMENRNRIIGNMLLGRAMGRVLAHELYHIVADTSQHGLNGVTRRALSPGQLTSGLLELQPSEVAAIQSGLKRPRGTPANERVSENGEPADPEGRRQ